MMGSPVPSARQTRAVRSREAVTILDPSGLKAALTTQSSCPRKTTGSPVPSACQTRAVPAAETVEQCRFSCHSHLDKVDFNAFAANTTKNFTRLNRLQK